MGGSHFIFFIVLTIQIASRGGRTQIPIYVVRIENLLKMQRGIGWPLQLNVVKGHEALLQLTSTLVNMQQCKVFTPTGIEIDARNPPSARYETWSNGCGLRVKNVTASDHGRWRLIASRDNESITGWSELNVQEDIVAYTPSDPIELQDGETHAEVELTTLQNSYCLVTQPFSESSLVSGHCRVTLDRTTRAVQGRWNVILGVPGRVSELQVERNIAVETEQLVSGYREEDTKLSLYCNIVHSARNITFCRFQKNAETTGFNIIDGLSDGHHSYYGDGFAKRQCGMTIEMPSADDYVTWRCTVGMQEWSGTTRRQSTPMQALIRVAPRNTFDTTSVTEKLNDEIRTLFVQRDSNLMIMCRAEMSLAYCWFQHPNGSQFTPVERHNEDEGEFWYTGESLQTGDCGITFAHVSEDDVGEWICHMGPKNQFGVEVTDRVIVRVTGPLAASKQEIDVTVGGEAILYCQTSNGPRPLDYCRFLSPNYVGFNLDSSVTYENPILNRFYFTTERSLDYGDCSLTINPVQIEDIGTWTCAGLVHDHTQESRDNIALVNTTTRSPARRAGIAAMSLALIGLTIALVVLIWHKKGRPLPCRQRTNVDNSAAVAFSHSTPNLSLSSSPRSSNDSANNIEMQTVTQN